MARPREMWLEEEFRARPREAGGWREVGESAGGAFPHCACRRASARPREAAIGGRKMSAAESQLSAADIS